MKFWINVNNVWTKVTTFFVKSQKTHFLNSANGAAYKNEFSFKAIEIHWKTVKSRQDWSQWTFSFVVFCVFSFDIY